jgi:hypothetical protein
MKSRLAVSLLFILIAANFTSDATAAFKKYRSWTGKICGRGASQVRHRLTPRDSAPMGAIKSNDKDEVTMIQLDDDRLPLRQNCTSAHQPRVVGTISPEGKVITFNSADATKLVSLQEGHTQGIVLKLVGSHYHSGAFDFVTTAARQIRQLLCLIRIK